MAIRLVFKDRKAAITEHVADRFNQVKDNWGFLVEEHTTSLRAGLARRLHGDISDLLRVDPDNVRGAPLLGRHQLGSQCDAAFHPATGAGRRAAVGISATRRSEAGPAVADWWIDNRQVPYGDFGGGISDDCDLIQQWPGLALMGVEPDKINASLMRSTTPHTATTCI